MSEDEQADLGSFDAGDDADGARDGTSDPDGDRSGSDVERVAPELDPPSLADLDRAERVELGVELLAHLEADSLPLAAAVDRIETVTTNPDLTREILDTAELRGVIERADGRLRTRRGGTFVTFDEQVVTREGDYECRRCGAGLSTGHFVRFDSGELGPFGPSCVRKVLGRE